MAGGSISHIETKFLIDAWFTGCDNEKEDVTTQA